MRIPSWTDGLYLNAATTNPAFLDAIGAAEEAAGVWALPGLVHPEAITWGASGLVVSGTMPAPFGILFPSGSVSGLVAGAHGSTTGSDSQSFSISLQPLVPASGPSVTAYIYAASGFVQQTQQAIVGPPQSNPAYNSAFVPFLTYNEQVATIVVSASLTAPAAPNYLLASTVLTSGQSSISSGSLNFSAQQVAGRIETAQFQQVTGSTSITAAQAGIVQQVTVTGATLTLPVAAAVAGRAFVFLGPVSGPAGYSTLQANGSDSIWGILPSTSLAAISLITGSRIHLVSNGSYWEATGAGLAPLTWAASGGLLSNISVSSASGVGLPYPTIVQGNGTTIPTLSVKDASNGNGANIGLYGNGATNPNKFIRAVNGVWELVNSGYADVIFSVDDAGNTEIFGGLTVLDGATFESTLAVGGLLSASGSIAAIANVQAGNELQGNAGVVTNGARGSGNTQRIVNLGDFPFTSSPNGYTYLPNGLIIQWGTNTGSASGPVGVNFPIAFPNAVLAITLSESESNESTWGDGFPTLHGSQPFSAVGFVHWSLSWNGSTWVEAANTCSWVAIGY